MRARVAEGRRRHRDGGGTPTDGDDTGPHRCRRARAAPGPEAHGTDTYGGEADRPQCGRARPGQGTGLARPAVGRDPPGGVDHVSLRKVRRAGARWRSRE